MDRGFTLLEVIITIVMVGLAGLAAILSVGPAFRDNAIPLANFKNYTVVEQGLEKATGIYRKELLLDYAITNQGIKDKIESDAAFTDFIRDNGINKECVIEQYCQGPDCSGAECCRLSLTKNKITLTVLFAN